MIEIKLNMTGENSEAKIVAAGNNQLIAAECTYAIKLIRDRLKGNIETDALIGFDISLVRGLMLALDMDPDKEAKSEAERICEILKEYFKGGSAK